MRTTTINFGWKDYKETYRINCDVCGKSMTRTISSGCNDMADAEYRRNLVEKLRQEASDREATEKETCSACQKKKIVQKHFTSSKIPANLCDNVSGLYNAYSEALKSLNAPYVGKIVRFDQAEWVLESIDHWNGLTCHLRRISKVRPWQTTDTHDHCRPDELDVTDEVFEDREKAVEV